jgi:hypothetical protein
VLAALLREVVAGRQPGLSTADDYGVDAFHASASFALIDEKSTVLLHFHLQRGATERDCHAPNGVCGWGIFS